MPAEAGLNMLQWDLRTAPAATFPGMILWGVRTMSPAVPPGTYTVRLTADGAERTTEIEVARHPWIEDVTDEDMEEQFEFGMRIRARVNEANSAVIAIRRVKSQLDDRLEASDDGPLAEAAEALRTAASEVEGNIYQVRNRSNQDPLNFPIRVNNRLANLLSMSERGDGRPGSGMYDVFEIMVAELEGYTTRLDEVWRVELAAVNRELERLGLAPVDPADESVELVS